MASNLSDWPQSIARTVVCKAYLSSDHVTAATGKTLALLISKNTAAFGNPSAGATNLTELSNGWYFWTSSTTDTGTLGPFIGRATAAGVDDVEFFFDVVDAAKGKTSNLDAASSAIKAQTDKLTFDAGNNILISSNVKKNATGGLVLDFLMTDSTTHAPKTGLVFGAGNTLIRKDAGAFGNTTNAATEVAGGWYTVTLTQAEVNANKITIRATIAAADDRDFTFYTDP